MIVQAIPGQWVSIVVPGVPWPAKMKIGGDGPEPAFIDRVLIGGKVHTVVKRRCPALPPGRHVVRILLPDAMMEATLEVPAM